MTCCSQRRQTLGVQSQLRAALAASSVDLRSDAMPATGSLRLRYVGDTPLNVRGPFSLQVYEVNASHRLIDADARDVAALLRTALFDRPD